jgi:V/A-type H+-transporting ATPase subunit D
MAELKYTKQELRAQQIRLAQLQRYLPTLQLRKALLQVEVLTARSIKERLDAEVHKEWQQLTQCAPLLTQAPTVNIASAAVVESVTRGHENIAGVELPTVDSVHFQPFDYDLYDTPPWLDRFVEELRTYRTAAVRSAVADERITILARELREVSIRVNLFEKVLVPRCVRNIKSIKIFLGDLQLTAVSQAKIAKSKILARKEVEV